MTQNAILFAAGVLLAGFTLRAGVRPLARLFVPASVVGGVIGFVLLQAGRRWDVTAATAGELQTTLGLWPSVLIAVVFAGMLLERPTQSLRDGLRGAAATGLFVWIIVVGQIAVGLATATFLLTPWLGVPPVFGQILEVTWAGGFGSATAWADVVDPRTLADGASAIYPGGRDLATFSAASGMVWGVLSGIVLVNWGLRRGWAARGVSGGIPLVTGLEERADPPPATRARVGSAVIDPLLFQGLILAAAFGAGWGMKLAVGAIGEWAFTSLGTPQYAIFLNNLPLFLFTLLGGLLVRELTYLLGFGDLIDGLSVRRLVGTAMDLLIVAALASMRTEALAGNATAMAVLLGVGAVWSFVTLIWLAPRMLPKGHWFELGLITYGMSTATTAQGMLLLRIVDKDLQTGAAEDYALAAPLSAPFIGGGIVSVTLPYLLLAFGAVPVTLVAGAVTAGLVGVGLAWRRGAGGITRTASGVG